MKKTIAAPIFYLIVFAGSVIIAVTGVAKQDINAVN